MLERKAIEMRNAGLEVANAWQAVVKQFGNLAGTIPQAMRSEIGRAHV